MLRFIALLSLLSIDVWAYDIGETVVLERGDQQFTRRIVGGPQSKVMPADAQFILRAQTTSTFHSPTLKVWFRGTPPIANGLDFTGQVGTVELLRTTQQAYQALPALGDSLYYVHAVPRTEEVNGETVTHEDSREWGAIHWRDIVRVVDD